MQDRGIVAYKVSALEILQTLPSRVQVSKFERLDEGNNGS